MQGFLVEKGLVSGGLLVSGGQSWDGRPFSWGRVFLRFHSQTLSLPLGQALAALQRALHDKHTV